MLLDGHEDSTKGPRTKQSVCYDILSAKELLVSVTFEMEIARWSYCHLSLLRKIKVEVGGTVCRYMESKTCATTESQHISVT